MPDAGGQLGEGSQRGGAGPTEVGSLSGRASWTCLPLWVLGTQVNGRERSEGWQRGRLRVEGRVERRVEATGKRTHTMPHKAPLSTHTSEDEVCQANVHHRPALALNRKPDRSLLVSVCGTTYYICN